MTGQAGSGQVNGAPPDLIGSWLHSYEEDTETTTVYRPSGHSFRPSRRVRQGLEFRADGTFVGLRPGPDDRPREVTGRWRAGAGGRVQVTLPQGHGPPFELDIVSCSGGVLTICR